MPHLRAMTPAAAAGKALALGTSLACKGHMSEAPARDRSWAISVSLAAPMVGGKTLDCARSDPVKASRADHPRGSPGEPDVAQAIRAGGTHCGHRRAPHVPPGPTSPAAWASPAGVVVRPAHAPAQRHPPYLRTPSRLPIGSLRPKSRRFRGTSASLPPGRYAGRPGAQALPLAGVHGSVLACRPSSQSGADVATTLL